MTDSTKNIKFEIGATGVDSNIYVDGERVTRVQTVDVHAGVGERTTVRVVRLLDPPALAEGSIEAEDLTITEVPGGKLARAFTRDLLVEVAFRMESSQNSDKGRELGVLCREALDHLDIGVLAYRRSTQPVPVVDALREVRDLLAAEWGHADAEHRPVALAAIARATEALGE